MCTWQSITNFLDGYFVVLIVPTRVAMFVTAEASPME